MMSEILRGDHAGLNDVFTPTKLSPLPKPDLPGITPKSHRKNVIQNSPLKKMDQMEHAYDSPAKKGRSKRKTNHQHKRSNLGPRGPNGEDSRGVPSNGYSFGRNPPSLPALSPQDLGQLKSPEAAREKQMWQRQRDDNIYQEVEFFRGMEKRDIKRQEKHAQRKANRRKKRKEAKKKRRWREKMEMEAGRINLQAMSHYLEPLSTSSKPSSKRSPFAEKMPLPSRPTEEKSSHRRSQSNRPKRNGKIIAAPQPHSHNQAGNQMLDSPEIRRRLAANLKRPEAAETSAAAVRGAFSGLLIAGGDDSLFGDSNGNLMPAAHTSTIEIRQMGDEPMMTDAFASLSNQKDSKKDAVEEDADYSDEFEKDCEDLTDIGNQEKDKSALEEAEAKKLAQERAAEDQKQTRLDEEMAARKIEEKRLADEKRLAEEKAAREIEEKRLAEEKAAKEIEEKRLAEEKLLAEEKRLAEEKLLAEEKRLAEEKAAREIEGKRKRIEDEKRIAAEDVARQEKETRLAEEQAAREMEDKILMDVDGEVKKAKNNQNVTEKELEFIEQPLTADLSVRNQIQQQGKSIENVDTENTPVQANTEIDSISEPQPESHQKVEVLERSSYPSLSTSNAMSEEQLTEILQPHDEMAPAIYSAMRDGQILPADIGHYFESELDDWERKDWLRKLSGAFCAISEQQLYHLVASIVSTVNSCFSSINGVLEEYSKTCGVENISVDEAISQVKSLLTTPPSLCKFCEHVAQQLCNQVPASKSIKKIKNRFLSSTLNTLIGHVAPGLECATVSNGGRNLKNMEMYIAKLGMPKILECPFFYNSSTKALFFHLHTFASGDECRIKFAVKRDQALAGSLQHAKKQGVLEKDFKMKVPYIFPLYIRDEKNFETGEGFKIEEGEGSGPRKEFFALCGEQLTQKAFKYQQSCESLWPNEQCTDSHLLRWIGFLFASCMSSKCTFGVPLPEYLFKCLKKEEYRPTEEDAKAFNNDLYRSMKDIREMKQAEYEKVLDADYMERSTTKDEYIRQNLDERMYQPVQWQIKLLGEGFRLAIKDGLFDKTGVDASDFSTILSGGEAATKNFKFHDVFKIAVDSEMDDFPLLNEILWKVIDNFDIEKKRNLVQFITGVKTLPFPKSEVIRIEMPFMSFGEEDTKNNFNRLPSAHTCTNTVELPNYLECMMKLRKYDSLDELDDSKKEILLSDLEKHLVEKFGIAIKEMSYGLDDIGKAENIIINSSAPEREETNDDSSDDLFGSFDSLDIPGLSSDDESPRF